MGLATIDGDDAQAVALSAPAGMVDSDLRIDHLARRLETAFAEGCFEGATLFAIERQHSFGNSADGPLYAAAHRFRVIAKRRGLRVVELDPPAWREAAVGFGNADKQQTLAAMNLMWGLELTDDNAGDALGIATAAAAGVVGRKQGRAKAFRWVRGRKR